MALRSSLRHTGAALLVFGAFSLSAPAFADTITLASGTNNTIVYYNNTAANAPASSLPTTGTASVVTFGYGTTIAGTSYVSYDPNTEAFLSGGPGDGVGTTLYTTTFTGMFAGHTGTLSFGADDSAVAFLNGVQIGTTGTSSYNTITGPFTFSNLVNGTNTLQFYVSNMGGPTNLDFQLNVAATPEPSSLMLLGTGILGAAGVMRRKFLS